MADTRIDTIERLEELAAWHRAIAERAGAAWVRKARLRTAEDLERPGGGLLCAAGVHWNEAIRRPCFFERDAARHSPTRPENTR